MILRFVHSDTMLVLSCEDAFPNFFPNVGNLRLSFQEKFFSRTYPKATALKVNFPPSFPVVLLFSRRTKASFEIGGSQPTDLLLRPPPPLASFLSRLSCEVNQFHLFCKTDLINQREEFPPLATVS